MVYLSRYDVHAIARYDDVHRALTDWQSLQSGAGVGLSNFTKEKPWRPPSLLLEADPPRHDSPRAVLEKILSPRQLRSMESDWRADAASLVDDVLSRGDEFDAVESLAEAFPLRVFPDAVGIGKEHREHLLPYGDFAFNAFGPQNERVTEPAKTIGPTIEWIASQCLRENLTDDRLRRTDLGGRRPRRDPARASTAHGALAPDGGSRHHRHRYRCRAARRGDASRPVGTTSCGPKPSPPRLRRGRPSRVARADLLPDDDHRRRASATRSSRPSARC